MTKIKFCGLTSQADIDYCNILKPDFVGFVFEPKSKRYISPDQAKNLVDNLDKDIKTVGVFAQLPSSLLEIYKYKEVVDMLQGPGSSEINTMSPRDILEFGIPSNSLTKYNLIDSSHFGGTGEKFDWGLLSQIASIDLENTFIAGGISISNIKELLQYNPFGIDISSGIESNGIKDYDKMKEIIELVRKIG